MFLKSTISYILFALVGATDDVLQKQSSDFEDNNPLLSAEEVQDNPNHFQNQTLYLKATSIKLSPLQCYATLASPNSKDNEKRIICPESRSNYCIKDVTYVARRKDCGISKEYPWDEWDIKLGQCVYRKCSSSCPQTPILGDKDDREEVNYTEDTFISSENNYINESKITTKYFFDEEGKKYKRETFCCSGSLCNTGMSMSTTLGLKVIIFNTITINMIMFFI